MQKKHNEFYEYCKTIDWSKIIDISLSLSDLNDSQYRFLKGRFIELLTEKFSNNTFKYVGEKHKDFICQTFNCSIELKSEVSQKLYNKKGLKSNFSIRLTNSLGTNKNDLNKSELADYLIILKKDGAVILDKNTILKTSKKNGDGFILQLNQSNVIELSGKIVSKNTYDLNIKKLIENILYEKINDLYTLQSDI